MLARRQPISFCFALLSSLLLIAGSTISCGPSAPAKDDILLISLDTLRSDHLSSYGYRRETSPFLDKLASEGARFAEAHSSASNTAPSHMSLLTGLDPLAHGIRPVGGAREKVTGLSPRSPILAEILKSVGYQTVGIADNGYVMTSMGFDRGFEYFDNQRTSLPQKLTMLSVKLKEVDPDKPLFVFFHTYEPHAPYLPPPPFHGRFTSESYTGPFRKRYDDLASLPVHVAWKQKGDFLKTWEGMSEVDLDFLRGLYDEGIAYTDSRIKRLWSIWSRRRNPEKTLLIIVSDHGEGFNEHGQLGHKYGLYSELLRVPLIVRGPGIQPIVIEQPVSLTDVVPTILDYLQLPSSTMQGESFLSLMRGNDSESQRFAVSQLNAKRGLHDSIVSDNLHLMRWNRPEGNKLDLFDNTVDRAEKVNSADARKADVTRLEKTLEQRRELGETHHERYPNLVNGELSEQDRVDLEALGYTDGQGYIEPDEDE
ncbi:MAG: arylsulfatase A-like enzyme [Planctomycetota bacterium]|jgi:arylsulfatase A-like enzyme